MKILLCGGVPCIIAHLVAERLQRTADDVVIEPILHGDRRGTRMLWQWPQLARLKRQRREAERVKHIAPPKMSGRESREARLSLERSSLELEGGGRESE